MDISIVIFKTLGGLGIFIYGMQIMSEGLQKIAGKKLRDILNVMTKNPFIGVLVGAVVTGIIQSSSTTTVMIVGFVNAGLLTLPQAISLVFGANIGTTITAQLIAFNIAKYALPAIALGVFIHFFSKKRTHQFLGQTILGFGFLFLGLQFMTEAFSFLKNDPTFHQMFILFSKNPFVAILAGTILTLIVQSSSATVGITQALATTGAINFMAAVPLVFGENIGTTITAQLAAIGTSRNSKRVAWAHTMFNVCGVIVFMIIFYIRYKGIPIYLYFINLITPGDVFLNNANISRHIANAHSFFNIFCTIIFLPLINLMTKIVTWIIPGEDDTLLLEPKYIDKRIATIPSIALDQAKKEIIYMMSISRKMLTLSMKGVFNIQEHKLNKILEMEKLVDTLQKEVIDFLVSIEEKELTEQEAQLNNCMLHLVNDVEKIADYALNITYLAETKVDEKLAFSTEANAELKQMLQDVDKECEISTTAFENNDLQLAYEAFQLEEKIDEEKDHLRTNHLRRLNHKICNLNAGILFTDIVNNLERISDHAVKFSKWLTNPQVLTK
ncbi:MAG: Na/Pi cotransporter family protein [Candidatus Margulisbacteria bacterium]|nr:Na/Pi cotransporter family protein [Candidatus Margulisiibacteriota bacterium]